MNFIEIQSWPEIPSIGYFVSLFSQIFDLPEFPDIEDLEEALLLDSSEYENSDDSLRLIPELIVSLLRGCDLVKPCQHITTSNYQMFLRRLFRSKCEEYKIENPFNTDTDFHILPLKTKVSILHHLCEFRLDSSDVEVKTNSLGADNLRIHPLGYDCNDSVYWYFYGTRLYREDLKPKVKGSNQQQRVWQVICFTEQDWVDLANKFKHSKSRKESAFYKALDEDFLPSIPVLFKAKQAEQRRRLLQKRSSVRVKSIVERRKDQQLLEQQKQTVKEKENKRNRRSSSDEKRDRIEEKIQREQERSYRAQRRSSSISSSSSLSVRSSCDLQSHLDFDSAYETTERSNKENILDFEETSADMKVKNLPQSATKLPGRQTNNSLSSFTGQIVIPSTASTSTTVNPPPPSNPRKKKVKTDESFMDSDEILNIGMHKVLMNLKNHDDAWPFMDPVEEEIAPRYYSIIKRPMDLLKMEEKLDNGEYRTFSEFKTDFKLIVNNCRLYNGQNNEYTEMVNNLQIAFDRGTRKYFDQSSSDEEQVLMEYPPIDSSVNRTSVNKSKEVKSEKMKHKEKKTVENDSESDAEEENEKISSKHKKTKMSKSNKHEQQNETEKKSEKITNSSESKKNKSTKAVKRKSKTKDHVKSKKMKKEIDNESENSDSDDEEVMKVEESKTTKEKKKKKNVLNQKSVKTNKKDAASDKKNNSKKSSHHVKAEKVNKVNKKKIPADDSSDDDSNSVRDLIEENVERKQQASDTKKHNKKSNNDAKSDKKKRTSIESVEIRKNGSKKKKINKKLSKENDLPISPSSSRPASPLFSSTGVIDDLNSSFDSSDRKLDDSIRSGTPEIKDKFDLIKERRNRMNQQLKEKVSVKKSSSLTPSTHKEKLKTPEKSKVKHEKSKKSNNSDKPSSFKESNSLFDKLKNEELEDRKKSSDEGTGKKSKSKGDDKKDHSSSKASKKEDVKEGKHQSTKNKKQNRASMDVLDMETEQTLKDINKWLEHTPRFEYSSASNSPSRYVIDELDMPSKIEDDFRKPIPLMPSSPSASQTNFQSPKDLNLLKESNNNNKNTSSMNNQVSGNSKKSGNKEPKRKNSKDKLQNVPKKKEVQRTIDRLQPGKTKGNLLNNVQNVNKPDEIYPLGSREKLKEVKNSLIVPTDDSSPKLSLGSVLDNQSFNLIDCDKMTKNEKYSNSDKDEDDINDLKTNPQSPKKVEDVETSNEKVDEVAESSMPKSENSSSKPNINAWFKAFGAPQKKPKRVEEEVKMKECDEMRTEGNYVPSHTRRLSTGSSISERSSGSSPHIGIDERGAPAPFPSPIGTSPSPMPSPRTDEMPKSSSSNYPVNGSTRVGFYQDMTSIKSSPEKSCSPREAPYSQYAQPSGYPSTVSPSTTSPHYGNFYPENLSPNKSNQAAYSKPTHSPASYYDQYKQPLSQESDFNNSMSPNTNPNSPYHSQQTSPYQQQPNSPFQTGGNTISPNNQTLNPTYTQPTSPYHQPQPSTQQKSQSGQFAQSASPPNASQKIQTPQNAITAFPNNQPPPMYQQQQQQQLVPPNSFVPPQDSQFARQKPEWNTVQQQQPTPYSAPNAPIQNNPVGQQLNQQDNAYSQDYNKKKTTLGDLENVAARVYAEANKNPELTNVVYPSAADKMKESIEPIDNSKFLDLSKVPSSRSAIIQHQQSINQYQQMYDLNYSKHGMEYDMAKAKAGEAYSRQVDKSHVAMPPASAGFWGNKPLENTEAFAAGQSEHGKVDSSGKGNAIFPPSVPHQQVSRGTPIDQNYKPPIFNNPTTSSMMDLTAFMRDFRHPDERFTSLPGSPGSFYDKNIPPAHMFSKNLPQTATSAAALQQMFNSSMNTMSYNRDQQNMNLSNYHHNRLNTPQAAIPTAAPTVAPEVTKPKKQKKKKNVTPEPAPLHPNYQGQAANQFQQQHPHHQQPISHQQTFQSYPGLKIPSNSTDPLKAVVPGSAFNYGPAPGLAGLYGDNSSYLEDYRGTANPYYPPGLAHRSTPETQLDKSAVNPPAAHPQAPPASPYHHLLPAHHPSRSSYPFMNSLDPAALQQQYRMMLNQTYQGYHSALSMHNQWPHHM